MAQYPAPTYPTNPIFNSLWWETGDTTLTIAEAQQLFLSINGNENVGGNVNFEGGLSTNTISPIAPGESLVFSSTGTAGFSGSVQVPAGSNFLISGSPLIASQAGNAGKYLTTNGTSTSWGAVSLVMPSTAPSFGVLYNGSGNTVTAASNFAYNPTTNQVLVFCPMSATGGVSCTSLNTTSLTVGGPLQIQPQYYLQFLANLNVTTNRYWSSSARTWNGQCPQGWTYPVNIGSLNGYLVCTCWGSANWAWCSGLVWQGGSSNLTGGGSIPSFSIGNGYFTINNSSGGAAVNFAVWLFTDGVNG